MSATKDGNGNGSRDGSVWVTGAQTIASKIGVDHRDIPELVRTENLPAFKWRGRWRALPEDLSKWSRSMAKRYRRNRAGPERKGLTGRPPKTTSP
jgi:hypothetical protein